MKQDERTRSIPVILVTALDRDSDVVDGLNAGADDYVTKPYKFEILLARTNAAIHRYEMVRENESLLHEVQLAATLDSLTGLLNRRTFFDHLRSELSRATRHHMHLSCVMLDIDFFKKINDDYGHAAGDAVLRRFALVVGETLRKIDVLCRYGGEEFCAILPETSISAAIKVAERVREAIERDSITFEDVELSITVSIGITAVTPLRGAEPDHLLSEADKALYDAKTSGRNRVEVFSREESHG